MGTLLIGYDVEYQQADGTTAKFLEQVRAVHERWDAPATFFLLGRTLELYTDPIRDALRSGLFVAGQHTYSHELLKTVYIEHDDTVMMIRGASLDLIDEELARTSRLMRDLLGIECEGLTAPWTYHRGLRDRPDVLEVLHRNGIRYVRSDGRDEHDWQPPPLTQPYWYARSGFPDILELCTHGWHDNVVREQVLGWDDLQGYVDLVTAGLDRAAEEDLVYSICAHDWSSVRGDPDLWHVDRILAHALDRGLEIRTYADVYREHLRDRS